MEFWGVEVQSGESLKIIPGDDKIIHLSMACLGEVKKDKGSDLVSLYVKFGNQKLALGTLSLEKFPQISYDLIFEKEFELSHNWKNGSVCFTGFRAESQLVSDNDEDSDDFDEEAIPLRAANGKPDVNIAKQKEKIENPDGEDANGEDEDEDSSDEDEDEDSSEDELVANGQIESSEDDDDDDSNDNENEDDDDSEDEETPKKAEGSSKRVHESPKKTPEPVKKAKFVTPEKTGGKNNGGHVATPYPKQAGKATVNDKQQVKQQSPKSGGDHSCKACNRFFKTEDALNSHNRAKHTAK